MFGGLLGNKRPNTSDWNAVGREIAAHNCRELTEVREGRSQSFDLCEDTRTLEMAQAVLKKVVKLNRDGKAEQARALFDPAHSPFIPIMEKSRGLKNCAILGADEFLVQQGAPYQNQTTWHIRGNDFHQIDNISCFSWSRDRSWFVTVSKDGSISLGRAFNSPEVETISKVDASAFIPPGLSDELRAKYAAPFEEHSYTRVVVSNDGNRVLLCDEGRGTLMLIRTNEGWQVKLLFPFVTPDYESDIRDILKDDPDEDFSPHLDMIHADMSPDGRFVAVGAQDDGHLLLEVDSNGEVRLYAHLGHISEYPHNACFSDDGRLVAFNSCHFYDGVTSVSEVEKIKGLTTEPYDYEHPLQPMVNDYLRVYASGFVPSQMADHKDGAFLLAGAGYAACVKPDGTLLWEIDFGSTAGGVDICPGTGRILLASYSGMLHLLDPNQTHSPIVFDGYKAPQEIKRWIFWDSLDHPIVW